MDILIWISLLQPAVLLSLVPLFQWIGIWPATSVVEHSQLDIPNLLQRVAKLENGVFPRNEALNLIQSINMLETEVDKLSQNLKETTANFNADSKLEVAQRTIQSDAQLGFLLIGLAIIQLVLAVSLVLLWRKHMAIEKNRSGNYRRGEMTKSANNNVPAEKTNVLPDTGTSD
ncbi:hypothetical protein MAR_009419 [Mya arenaria]|uniref:Uncharacterized protein n=1 Tax=Mya arenaria TaxID=6604 RepID=A0ABY7E6T4_MYAAR|nr:uncharacterized protein LOC128232913 [Mya arenaria]WAR02861.1 hypothetical protein MAR_009419 [Mya arenaria]